MDPILEATPTNIFHSVFYLPFFHFFVFKYLYFFLQYKISISSMPIAHTVTPNYKQHIQGFFGEQKKQEFEHNKAASFVEAEAT